MTVKCLTSQQKAHVTSMFDCGLNTINELAQMHQVSRRTIIRVLEEAGIDPGIRHRTPKQPISVAAPPAPEPPQQHQQTQPLAWYQRTLSKLGSYFSLHHQ